MFGQPVLVLSWLGNQLSSSHDLQPVLVFSFLNHVYCLFSVRLDVWVGVYLWFSVSWLCLKNKSFQLIIFKLDIRRKGLRRSLKSNIFNPISCEQVMFRLNILIQDKFSNKIQLQNYTFNSRPSMQVQAKYQFIVKANFFYLQQT